MSFIYLSKKTIRRLCLLLLILGQGLLTSTAFGGSLPTPYTNSTQLTSLTWPYSSHWLQPWRAYLETVPAQRFINGIGINLADENPTLAVQMLAKYGVRNARIEINWGAVDYNDETQLMPSASSDLTTKLQACKKWGVRPLILLNSHHGNPTPFFTFPRTLTANAPQGATQLQLNDTSNLVLGRSGISNLTDYWAAEVLITAVNGNKVTLSKPLPYALNAGKVLDMATLKYRPFSTPGTADYNETLAAWQRYVNTVATFVANTLGTSNSSDKGFDLEIWNELTFGTHFLYLNDYYTAYPYDHPAEAIWGALVQATANTVNATPSRFQGVTLVDGFSNTTPWRAADQEPARVGAMSKHPYQTLDPYPSGDGDWLNALGQPDAYQPTYVAHFFPEYYGSALPAETFIRDMAPLTTRYTDIFGEDHAHGRNARLINGQVAPVTAWITEVGLAPREDGITDRQQALALKNKAVARYFAFYLNKGVNKLFIYSSSGNTDENGNRDSDLDFGLLQQNFVTYLQTNSTYPADDRPYVSPALQTLGRMVSKMQDGLDPAFTNTRALRVDALSDTHNHTQFTGDGTAAHPNLYDRDVFAFLPYQVNARRFVIPYYVMTHDLTTALGQENFTIQLAGIDGVSAAVSVYDPLQDRAIPLTVNGRSATTLNLTLTATDTPYLLLIDEQAPTNLTAKALSNSQISLTWSDNSTNETGFKIERCQNVGCTAFTQIAPVGANVTTYIDAGLTANTSYTYRLRASTTAGDSGYSNLASAVTLTLPPTVTPTPLPTPIKTPLPTVTPTVTPMSGCLISLNNGALFTNQRTVTVQANVPNAVQMQLSNDGGFAGATWQNYQTLTSWTLPDIGQRIATLLVHARFRDANNNVLCNGLAAIDEIIFDVQAPKLTAVSSAAGQLHIQAEDQPGGSGVAEMEISTHSDFADADWQPWQAELTLDEALGTTLYVRVRDGAGNESQTVQTTVASTLYLPAVMR
ncbi:MAG: fibronectin type III domain-containing protein [Caldilineaceae bacterium]